MEKKDIKLLFEKINEYEDIFVFSHTDGDGDSNGSLFAMTNFLKLNFKDKNIVAIGSTWRSKLSDFFPSKSKGTKKSDFLAIVVDTANQPRIDDPKNIINLAKYVIKIDHHPEDDKYGDLQIVNDKSSSTCEMLYNIFTSKKEYEIDKDISRFLFIGILTDTGRFRYDNTSSSTFLTLSKLFEYDLQTNSIYNTMLSQTINEVKFRAYIQSNSKVKGDLIYFILPKGKEKKFDLNNNQISGYVYSLGNIEGITKWMYASYSNKKKLWKISIRSNDKAINGIASNFGGGGHDKASGAAVQKKSELKKLIKQLEEL